MPSFLAKAAAGKGLQARVTTEVVTGVRRAHRSACQQVLQQRGLKHQLGPNSTAIEGDWGPVMEAVKACHEVVHELGAPRIFTTLKINSRTDRDQALEEKTAAVQQLLA